MSGPIKETKIFKRSVYSLILQKKKKKSYLELKSQQIPYPSHQAHPSLHLLLSS